MTENEYNPDVVSPPGDTLLEMVLARCVYDDKLATQIEGVIRNQTSITEEIAAALGSYCGVQKKFWLNRQKTYDEYIARSKR